MPDLYPASCTQSRAARYVKDAACCSTCAGTHQSLELCPPGICTMMRNKVRAHPPGGGGDRGGLPKNLRESETAYDVDSSTPNVPSIGYK